MQNLLGGQEHQRPQQQEKKSNFHDYFPFEYLLQSQNIKQKQAQELQQQQLQNQQMQQPMMQAPSFGQQQPVQQAKPPQHLNLTGVSQAPSPFPPPTFSAQSNQMQIINQQASPQAAMPCSMPPQSQLQQQLQQLLLLQQQQQQQQQQLIQQMLPQSCLSDHDQLLHAQQLQIQQLQQQLQMQSKQLRQPPMQQPPLSLQQLMQAHRVPQHPADHSQSRADSNAMQVQQSVWLPPSTPNLSSAMPNAFTPAPSTFGVYTGALPAQEQLAIEKRKKVVAQRSSKKTAPKSNAGQLRQRDEFGHFMPNKNKLCKTEVMEIQLQAQNSDSECRALRKELSEKDSEIEQLKKKLRELQHANQEQQHRIHSMEQQQQQSFEQLDAIRIFKQRMTYLKQLEQHFEEKRKREEEDEALDHPAPHAPFAAKSPFNTPRPYLGAPSDGAAGGLTSPRRPIASGPINFPSRDRPLHSPTKSAPVELKKEKAEPIKQPPSYWFPNVYNSSIPRQFREKIDFSKIELKPCGKPPSLVEIAISQHWESERMMKEQLDLVAKQIQTNQIHHHTPSTRNIGNPEAFSQKIDFKEELKKLRKINSTVKKEFSEWLLAQPDSPAPPPAPSPTLSTSPSTPNLLGTPSTPTLLMSALTVRSGTPLPSPNVALPHTPSTAATLMPKGVTTRAQANSNNNSHCTITNSNNSNHSKNDMSPINSNSDESRIIIKIDDEDLDETRDLHSRKTDSNTDHAAEYKKELNFDDNNEKIKDSLFGSSENSGASLFDGSGGLFSSSSSLFHSNNDSANSPPAYMEVMQEDAYGHSLFIEDENRNQFDSSFILARSLSPDEKW